ncbi:hypothetical protein HDU98_003705 [Podochytrium sp. JEL0797]|nr:hypothetical protein HDU98_003705 [Podochytrium sp. JEL0797]
MNNNRPPPKNDIEMAQLHGDTTAITIDHETTESATAAVTGFNISDRISLDKAQSRTETASAEPWLVSSVGANDAATEKDFQLVTRRREQKKATPPKPRPKSAVLFPSALKMSSFGDDADVQDPVPSLPQDHALRIQKQKPKNSLADFSLEDAILHERQRVVDRPISLSLPRSHRFEVPKSPQPYNNRRRSSSAASFAIPEDLKFHPPPTSPSPRPKSMIGPSSLYRAGRASFSDTESIHETADILGLSSAKSVKRVMKDKKISTWAAVLAVGGSARSIRSPNGSLRSLGSGSERDGTFQGEDGDDSSDESSEEDEEAKEKAERKRMKKRQREVREKQLLEEIQKRNFIAKLSKAFYAYGAPTHQLEPHLAQVAKALHVEADFLLLPGVILISFGVVGQGDTKTQIVKQGSGMNMNKLAQVNALCQTTLKGLIDVRSATDLLNVIISEPDYPWWFAFFTYPSIGIIFAVIFFQTSWIEGVLAGTLALVSSIIANSLDTVSFSMCPEFLSAVVASFVCKALEPVFYQNGLCFDSLKVVLCSLLYYIPGMQLVLAVLELSTRNVICGVIRMFMAMFTSGLLAFGMMVGQSMVVWYPDTVAEAPVCTPITLWWAFLLFPPMALLINLSIQANKHQWPIMAVTTLVGYGVNKGMGVIPFAFEPVAVNVFVSGAIGITANIYARVTKDIAVGPIYAAVWIQVPGSISVKSALGFFLSTANSSKPEQNFSGISMSSGTDFVGQMLSTSISLALGLFIAAMIVWPMKRPKHEYMTI